MSRIAFICAFHVSPISTDNTIDGTKNAENALTDHEHNAPDAIDDPDTLDEPVAPDDHDSLGQEIALDHADLCSPYVQQPVPLPEVKLPTAEEIARHNRTHLP